MSQIRRELRMRDLYNFPRRSYWLRRMENEGRKERVSVDEYTIEHIMPQTLNQAWKDALMPDGQQVHAKWLDTLGNLTLSGYNSELGNRLFSDKKRLLLESNFALSRDLQNFEVWDGAAIQRRGEELALRAVTIWRR